MNVDLTDAPPRVCLAALIALSGCGGGASDTAENRYENGFRLVGVSIDNLLFDSLDSTSVYDYESSTNEILYTRTSYDDGVEETVDGVLTVDAAGRLVKVRLESAQGVSETDYIYDGAGRLIEVDGGRYDLTLEYSGALLRAVREDALDLEISFTYGEGPLPLSEFDQLHGSTTRFSYDASGRRTSAVTTLATGLAGFGREYEYDDDGNLVKRTVTRPRFGDVYQVELYEYEPNTRAMYNHELMRLETQPTSDVIFDLVKPTRSRPDGAHPEG